MLETVTYGKRSAHSHGSGNNEQRTESEKRCAMRPQRHAECSACYSTRGIAVEEEWEKRRKPARGAGAGAAVLRPECQNNQEQYRNGYAGWRCYRSAICEAAV